MEALKDSQGKDSSKRIGGFALLGVGVGMMVYGGIGANDSAITAGRWLLGFGSGLLLGGVAERFMPGGGK